MTEKITTVEELDALPVGSVVRDGDGDEWTRLEAGWDTPDAAGPEESAWFLSTWGPLRLISRPDVPAPAAEDVEALAAARKIVQWGIAEARERDAMHEEAASIGIEHDLDDAEIDALAEKIERTLTAFLAWFAARQPAPVVSAGQAWDEGFAAVREGDVCGDPACCPEPSTNPYRTEAQP